MPFPRRAPSRALLSALRTSSNSTPYFRAAARQIRWESTEPKPPPGEGRSFKGQIYESVATRLQREREEQARFIKERDEGSGPRNIATTVGMSKIFSLAGYPTDL
jgi:D-lactate dehydrogenase (cytochrome)